MTTLALRRADARLPIAALLLGVLGLIAACWFALVAYPGFMRPSASVPSSDLRFSTQPADREFLRIGLFAQPLIPVGATFPSENADLATAITAYADAVTKSGGRDAVAPLTAFLSAHPASAWRPALLVNLGMIYRQTGHFSKAMGAFSAAWSATKERIDENGRTIGDVAVGELTEFQAYLGRKEELAPLLAQIKSRNIHGSAAELVSSAARGLAHMQEWPGESFRCGPLALMRILMNLNPHPSALAMQVLTEAKSTPNGLSLSMVQGIAAKAEMHYQMAFRPKGAPITFPAVAHWKMGHYAAIVGQSNGRYLVQDSTFGEDISVDATTLDEEASGYFLIPAGPLPKGWRSVASAEGDKIWGRGDTGNSKEPGGTGGNSGTPANPDGSGGNGNPTGVNSDPTGDQTQPTQCRSGGCTTWNVEAMTVSLLLHDRPVGYTPPVGPAINIDIDYSHRDVDQPGTFNYVNLGRKWTVNWLSYVTDTVTSNRQGTIYLRGGGTETFTYASTSATSSAPGQFSQAVLTRTVGTGNTSTGFKRLLKDGSTETYSTALGNKFFLTEIADPQGNKVTVAYDAQFRITGITDAIGQVTSFAYGNADPLKITKITDPFGRATTFTYNGSGQLASITDTIGITSNFTYGTGDFITTLTTPYGTSTFEYGDSTTDPTLRDTRFLNTSDALGRKSRVEFNQYSGPGQDPVGVPAGSGAQNVYTAYRNTFIWNPEEYRAAQQGSAFDYTKARIIHWLHNYNGTATSRVIESTKEPGENRVWYRYPGKTNSYYAGTYNTPTYIGRVLDNGTTQANRYEYNAAGNVTKYTDPNGRVTDYTYDATGIDRIAVRNTSAGGALLAQVTYNGQHLPVSVTGANGATASRAYNSRGQVTSATNALNQTSTYSYDGNGYLTTVQGPTSGATYSFTYDSAGRVATAIDPAGAKVSYTYDNADRPLSATFPDGTAARYAYNLLDLATSTDRLGQATQLTYDAERQLVKVADPLGQVTQYAYSLAGQLASITDPNNHVTGTARDLQSRIISKTYADGTRQVLTYEGSTSRIKTVTDARGQATTYAYNVDDSIASVAYTNAPAVSFRYDAAYLRPVAMIDGIGTATYAYGDVGTAGANRIKSATMPVAGSAGVNDVISYAYDALNRVTRRTVNGADQTTGYDALGRVNNVANALDSFTYGYGDATARVSQVSSIKGPGLALTYFDGTGDEQLKQMKYTSGSSTLSQFAYEYNANDNVTKLTDAHVAQRLAALGVTPQMADGASSGNPTSAIVRASLAPVASTALVAIASRNLEATVSLIVMVLSGLGWLSFFADERWRPLWMIPPMLAFSLLPGCGGDSGSTGGGSTTPPTATATAKVTAYSYDKASRLTSAATGTDIAPPTGTPPYSYAYDAASNLTSITENGPQKALSYTPTNAIASGTYDPNGSPTTLDGATYTWDGANRLLTSIISGKETNFYYDGLSRLVRIVEKVSGAVTADHAYGWCGNSRCIERDNRQSGSPITKQYFGQGEMQGATALYYITDRLGSVRQLVDSSGAVQAQYDYDPYGRRSKVSGTKDSEAGFTGLFHNDASGLDFAVYRAYSPSNARWLNRDPIAEAGGLNLYGYVGGNPVRTRDLLGLQTVNTSLPFGGLGNPGATVMGRAIRNWGNDGTQAPLGSQGTDNFGNPWNPNYPFDPPLPPPPPSKNYCTKGDPDGGPSPIPIWPF